MREINPRGFTIVELAVALVVIGIILGMVVKGKALVDVAYFKREVNKIRKLEAAMHTYSTLHTDFMFSSDGYRSIDLQSFYDLGIVSPGELESDYRYSGLMTTKYVPHYTPINCYIRPDGYYRLYGGGNRPKDYDFCAVLLNFSGTTQSGNSIFLAPLPLRMQCGIEVMLDDENISSGLGRRGSHRDNIDSTDLTADEYADCMDVSNDIDMSSEIKNYFYKVF